MFDGIEYRGYEQKPVEIPGQDVRVSVWNGLTDEFHPTQMLADVLTMMEHSNKPLEEIAYCYTGNARFNMGNSLMIVGCLLGMGARICCPKELAPDEALFAKTRELPER